MKKCTTTYRTKDLYEASFLYASQAKLANINNPSENFRSFWFVFEDHDKCVELLTAYWQKSAPIDAKTFVDSIRNIKSLILKYRDGASPESTSGVGK